MLGIEHFPYNFGICLSPSQVISGLKPLYFSSITPSSIFTFTIGNNPRPERKIYLSQVFFSPRILSKYSLVIQRYNMYMYLFSL